MLSSSVVRQVRPLTCLSRPLRLFPSKIYAAMKPTDDEQQIRKPLEPSSVSGEILVVKVEEAGKEAWSGVAQAEAEKAPTSAFLPTTILLLGDAVVFLVFATMGRSFHGEGVSVTGILSTGVPFYTGWIISAWLLGGYGKDAKCGKIGPAAATVLKCWLLGAPTGLGLHALAVGHLPPVPFAVVAATVPFAFLMTWRLAYAALTPAVEDSKISPTKRGSPFEFLSFLNSIVRRW